MSLNAHGFKHPREQVFQCFVHSSALKGDKRGRSESQLLWFIIVCPSQIMKAVLKSTIMSYIPTFEPAMAREPLLILH